eukprot:1335961-Alexandrium_andersonii.AAC.1
MPRALSSRASSPTFQGSRASSLGSAGRGRAPGAPPAELQDPAAEGPAVARGDPLRRTAGILRRDFRRVFQRSRGPRRRPRGA